MKFLKTIEPDYSYLFKFQDEMIKNLENDKKRNDMNRSGYGENETSKANLCLGPIASAIKGKRGQAFLIETLAALDAMPHKRLITEEFQEYISGDFCTLGVVGNSRGLDLQGDVDVDSYAVSEKLGISRTLAAEVMHKNDEGGCNCETPEVRWKRMRTWVKSKIHENT